MHAARTRRAPFTPVLRGDYHSLVDSIGESKSFVPLANFIIVFSLPVNHNPCLRASPLIH